MQFQETTLTGNLDLLGSLSIPTMYPFTNQQLAEELARRLTVQGETLVSAREACQLVRRAIAKMGE